MDPRERAKLFRFDHAASVEPLERELRDCYALAELCDRESFALEIAPLEFIKIIEDLVPGSRVVGTQPNKFRIVSDAVMVQVSVGGRGGATSAARHHFDVIATGCRKSVPTLLECLRKQYGENRIATVSWWFRSRDSVEVRTVPIEPPPPWRRGLAMKVRRAEH